MVAGVQEVAERKEFLVAGPDTYGIHNFFDHTVPERIDPRGLLVTQRNEWVNLGRVLCGNRCREKGTGGQNYGS
jgi:hypothetical protein